MRPSNKRRRFGSIAVEAEVINRILSARLIWLKDKLATEEEKINSYKKQLKDLEKQSRHRFAVRFLSVRLAADSL
jgi:hypothetical protein